MNKKQINWTSRDIALLIIFSLAILSLMHFFGRGLTNLVNITDRENKTYGDFQEYYYPAAKVIFQHPKPLGGYFYTPTFAIFLHYLVDRTPEQALIVWQIFQHFWIILILIVPALFLANLAGKKSYAFYYVAALISAYPIFHNLKWGQVSVLITFCSIFSLMLYERKKIKTAAFFLALATTVKYYPGFLLAGFLFKKDWKFISLFAGFLFILGLVIPGAMIGFSTTVEFYRLSLAEMNYALDWVAQDINSQYFAHTVIRIFGLNPDSKGIVSLVGMLICLLTLGKMYQPYRNSTRHNTDIQVFIIPFLLMPFLINTSWPHYFAWLPFCGVLSIITNTCRPAKLLSAVALVLQSVAILAIFPSYKEYVFSGVLLFANMLILISFFMQKPEPVEN